MKISATSCLIVNYVAHYKKSEFDAGSSGNEIEQHAEFNIKLAQIGLHWNEEILLLGDEMVVQFL